ncbi:MAG: hypothetical protein HWD59_00710 [Coxiellaceae bacterium]|nr:MAG: hypothetical protein HWD59_00710 [Coxiellaceae bacterium]
MTQLINSVKNIKYEGQTNIWDHCLQSLSKIKLDTLKDAIGHYLDFPVAAFSVKTICEQETNTAKRLDI